MRWPPDEQAEVGREAPREHSGVLDDLAALLGSLARTVILLTVVLIVIVGGLWLLNNTHEGLVIKCHVLGDWGACLLSS
jgi:hypothetical protein